ncbi:hypothetical protein MTBSS4_60001 [Magnetospirillum sp. SS-4]|nr:hypothetical protein MTBSS4_60001 [Magnetospirillum sp. SS-4]
MPSTSRPTGQVVAIRSWTRYGRPALSGRETLWQGVPASNSATTSAALSTATMSSSIARSRTASPFCMCYMGHAISAACSEQTVRTACDNGLSGNLTAPHKKAFIFSVEISIDRIDVQTASLIPNFEFLQSYGTETRPADHVGAKHERDYVTA